jgi:N-acetylneuraminate synthase
MTNFKLDKRLIGNKYNPLIIAEIGINHEGQLWKAKKMIDDAYAAGCECVKFQYHIPEEEMIKNNTIPGNAKESIWSIIKRCTLNESQEIELFEYVKKKNMIYLSTPFSKQAAEKLYQMGVSGFKIGSGECNNFPLIDFISRYKKPIILSTGMNDLKKIKTSIEIIKKNKCAFALMHCVSLYPTPYNKLNLNKMLKLKKIYPNIPIGLSDHTLGIHASLAAVSLGANIIEKHFTSSKKWKGPDISISIDKNDLKTLKIFSEDIFSTLSNNITEKKMRSFEKKTIDFAYSSVVSTTEIEKGKKLNKKNIWVKRPGLGDYLAKDYKILLGKKAKRKILANRYIKKKDLY